MSYLSIAHNKGGIENKATLVRNTPQKKYMDWIDANNEGTLHFGIHTTYLPQYSIKFDTFHMKCAITRSMISYVQMFVLSQLMDFIEKLKIIYTQFGDSSMFLYFLTTNHFAHFMVIS